jgi:hypothetical protein
LLRDFQKLNYSIVRAKIIVRFFLPLLMKVMEYFFNWKPLKWRVWHRLYHAIKRLLVAMP